MLDVVVRRCCCWGEPVPLPKEPERFEECCDDSDDDRAAAAALGGEPNGDGAGGLAKLILYLPKTVYLKGSSQRYLAVSLQYGEGTALLYQLQQC